MTELPPLLPLRESYTWRAWLGVAARLVLLIALLIFFFGDYNEFKTAWQSSLPAATPDVILKYPGALLRWVQRTYVVPAAAPSGSSQKAVLAQQQRFRDWMYQVGAINWGIGALLIPLALAMIIGPRSLRDLGLRWPNRAGWTLLMLGFAVALIPVLIMARNPVFTTVYRQQYDLTRWFAISALLSIFPEHFFMQGVVLAWLHPLGRFPPDRPAGNAITGDQLNGAAQIVADDAPIAAPWSPSQSWEWGRFFASLAVPARCIPGIVLGGFLFFVIHYGKPPIEMWLSWPGGSALCWIAYRCNGFVVPLLLHLVLAILAFAVAVWL